MDLLLYLYIGVWVLATNALIVWFRTSMSIRIMKRLRIIPEEIYTNDEASTYLVINRGLIGELLSCPICLAHWLSALSAILVVLFFGISWWFVLFCAITQPFLSTSVLNKWH